MDSMTTASVQHLEWPFEESIIVTLDFECDYGTALAENTYQAVDHVDTLIEILERLDVPLTVFVQTELLTERPEVVEELRNCSVDVRFHPHSHTHRPRDETSIQQEITDSTREFESFFGHHPSGYRLPNGNIRESDYQYLADAGYDFDASLFPSWRPNHFNNTAAPTDPHYLPEHDLVEIPFTVYSSFLRIPTALSYCRLLGRPFTQLLTTRPPSVVIFNIHMHDLVNPASFAELSTFYKSIYSRNDDGFAMFESILEQFSQRDYTFRTVDDAYDDFVVE